MTEGKCVSQEKGEKTNPKQNFREGRKEEKKIQYLALWNSLEANLLCNVFVF